MMTMNRVVMILEEELILVNKDFCLKNRKIYLFIAWKLGIDPTLSKRIEQSEKETVMKSTAPGSRPANSLENTGRFSINIIVIVNLCTL